MDITKGIAVHITTGNGENVDLSSEQWRMDTVGDFISRLIDDGDAAIMFRTTNKSKLDKDGFFVRTMEIVSIPQGHVIEHVKQCETMGHRLYRFIEEGLVK